MPILTLRRAEFEQINETGDWDDDIEKQFTDFVEDFKKNPNLLS